MNGERRLDPRTAQQLERCLRSRRAELDGRARRFTAEPDAAELGRVGCQIAQVEAALTQLSQGDYGWCAECGGFIGLARLGLLPFTRRCHACRDVLTAVPAAVAPETEP
jgi:RNA polymerase-binding transcription factor DksA